MNIITKGHLTVNMLRLEALNLPVRWHNSATEPLLLERGFMLRGGEGGFEYWLCPLTQSHVEMFHCVCWHCLHKLPLSHLSSSSSPTPALLKSNAVSLSGSEKKRQTSSQNLCVFYKLLNIHEVSDK